MTVKLRAVKDNEPVEIYDPEGRLMIFTNNPLIFNDIRIQIMDEKISGYYIIFKNERIDIKDTGELDNWPNGLFTAETDQLNYLFGI